MLAAFKLRAVPINVNYRYGADELRYLLDDADARAVVYDREFAPVARCDPRRPDRRWTCSSRSPTTPVRRHPPAGARRCGRVRDRARRRIRRPRLRGALGRRPVHPLHRRHHGHAQRRDVARRGHLLRCLRRREPRRRADHRSRAGRRRLRPPPARPARVPVHARHRALDGVRHPLLGWHRGDLPRAALRPRAPLAAHRSGTGHLPRDRRGRVRAPAGRDLRPPRSARRRHPAHGRALGRRGALAGGQGRVGRTGSRAPCSSTASARRRPAARARASRPPAARSRAWRASA